MKKILLTALLVVNSAAAQELALADVQDMVNQSTASCVSIHDPSVVFHNGQFTIWGSHLGLAQSNDMVTFQGMSANNSFRRLATQGAATGTACGHADAFSVQQITQVKDLKGETVSFPNFNARAYCSRYAGENKDGWIDGNMWAPDIIYNPTMKKWCMYMSLNGDNWSSIIVLLTAPTATGPFTYQGPVVMGGFNGQTYNNVKAPTLAETDLKLALGNELTAIPARYLQANNGTYWPNCIDPCTFFDEDGELWMAYGSWSGGIFLLKLDKQTGLRDYTYIYNNEYDTKGANALSDPYFGLKIAGGHYVSGEGSYIQHIGNYYYLWMSYGFFSPDGGYDMRVFRSDKPTGPYVDANGRVATFTGYEMNYGPNSKPRGMRLMGNYNGWGLQSVGQRAMGHNSVCADDQGRTFLVTHTKFNDGTAGHQVRVHQLFLNEKGWPVASPFTYNGEALTDSDLSQGNPIATERIPGNYHLLIHPYGQVYEEVNGKMEEKRPQNITLTADGKVTGDLTGTWKQTQGTGYVQLYLSGITYYGVLCQNNVDGATPRSLRRSNLNTFSITAQATNGTPLWAYRLDEPGAIAVNLEAHAFPLKENQTVGSHQSLMFDATDNVNVSWTSSEPEIISETGKYNPAAEVTPVTLTRTLQAGTYTLTQSANVRAQAATQPSGDAITGLVAYYNMDAMPLYNQYHATSGADYDRATPNHAGSGTNPSLVADWDRLGKVLQLHDGEQGGHSYLRTANPLYQAQEAEGFSLSFWVLRQDDNATGSLFALGSNYVGSPQASRFFLTGNTMAEFNNDNGTQFLLNDAAKKTLTTIPVGKWSLVTLTCGAENGIRLYVDGRYRSWSSIESAPSATTAKQLPWEELAQWATTARYIFLGSGSPNGSPQARIDDLMLWNRELSSTDVSALSTLLKRVTDFTTGNLGTAITAPREETSPQGTVYDLNGRPMRRDAHGIGIRNGQKIVR